MMGMMFSMMLAIMGPISDKPFTYDAIHAAEDKTGKGIIQIDTPTLVMDDNAQARKESEAILDKSRKGGATFCLIHHSAAEQLVNKNKRTMDRLPDYLKMIRDRGMIPGLSAHMPELILYSDLNGYDVETYVSARHRQFLDLPRNDGIWVLTRASDSTLPVDVATMIYYLLNTVVQFLQQCVHHSERRGGGSPKAGASSRSWRPTGSAVCRSWCR